jgi:hypothetical protein
MFISKRQGSVQFSSAREAVKKGPERVKLMNVHRCCCQGTAGEDTAGWKKA